MATRKDSSLRQAKVERLSEPPVARALFSSVNWAWLWLLVRLYLGYEWISAGVSKIGSPAWTGDDAGAALTGFVNGALQKTAGEHPDVQGWYAWTLRNVVLPNDAVFAYLVSFGEFLVGVALILGFFTGIAAFFGVFLNANFLFAGAVSTNPVLILLAIFLVLAWRTAGWWGVDRWVLPALGTPWATGLIFKGERAP